MPVSISRQKRLTLYLYVPGLGHALLYCPNLFILSQYFNHRRSITTIIASCGGSVGGVVFPWLTRYLLTEYGLQGGLILLSTALLHQLPFILLFTPPEEYHTKLISIPTTVPSQDSKLLSIPSTLISHIVLSLSICPVNMKLLFGF